MIQPIHRNGTARLVVAVNLAAIFMGSTLLTPLYPLYARKFEFSELTLTLIYAIYVVGNLTALFFLGRLSDQIGRRRVSLPAIGLACISTLIFLFAPGSLWLFAARVLSGFAIGLASGTYTAWIAELTEGEDKSGASVMASSANTLGLAIGPLMGGLLAQYAPAPLYLSFVIYLLLLIIMALFIRNTRETVEHPVGMLREASFKPRFGIPREIRIPFLPPAATAFATFAIGGFYAALVPTLVIQDLHKSNLAIGGDIVFELFLTAAIAIILTRRLKSRTAILTGLGLFIPSLVLLMMAQEFRSLPVLFAGTAVTGLAVALGYRGSLQVVNQIAPTEKRAEVISSYLVMCYLGNSLPVIGVGVGSHVADPDTANLTFAVIISLCVFAALAMGRRFSPESWWPAGRDSLRCGEESSPTCDP